MRNWVTLGCMECNWCLETNIGGLECTIKFLPMLISVKYVIGFNQASIPCHPITSHFFYEFRISMEFGFCGTTYPYNTRGTKFIMVMIEHFKVWVKLVVLPQNSSKLAAAAYLNCILACFGAPAKVLTHQGREFIGYFENLCTKTLINHRNTSWNHLDMDSLAKHVVQMVKWGCINMVYYNATNMIGTLCYHG